MLEEVGDDQYYDAQGNIDPNGIYDVGGHLISERWYEYAEYLYDQSRHM